MLFCDECDRGYHSFCVGLKQIPVGEYITIVITLESHWIWSLVRVIISYIFLFLAFLVNLDNNRSTLLYTLIAVILTFWLSLNAPKLKFHREKTFKDFLERGGEGRGDWVGGRGRGEGEEGGGRGEGGRGKERGWTLECDTHDQNYEPFAKTTKPKVENWTIP